MSFRPPKPLSVHVRSMCVLCTLHLKQQATQQMKSVIGCSARRRQKSECLPPTSDSLHLHIERANYQSFIWKRSLHAQQELPEPDGHGWQATEDGSQPLLMTMDPAPVGLLELTTCRCQKSACQRNHICACKCNDMPCTEACICMGGEDCKNPCMVASTDSTDYEDNDDDNE